MLAEVEFLHYAAQVAPGYTPTLIHVDQDHRCVVMEYIEGEAFPEGSPPPESAVACAVKFFRLLNSDQTVAAQLICQHAADGFLKLTEHLNNIKNRLSGMGCEHLPATTKAQAKNLLNIIQINYQKVYETIADHIASGRVIDSIRLNDLCISPSDFGFHNAIATTDGVKFIDFEFAGWDDPAKAAIDFVLQPRVPVMQAQSPLLASLSGRQYDFFNERYKALLPVLHLKWLCIILSVFNPERFREIILTGSSNEAERLVSDRMIAAATHLKRPFMCRTSLLKVKY
jgi:hypothetical protein